MSYQFIKIPSNFTTSELWVDKNLITHWHVIKNKITDKTPDPNNDIKINNECILVHLRDKFDSPRPFTNNIFVPSTFVTCKFDKDAQFSYNRIKELTLGYPVYSDYASSR